MHIADVSDFVLVSSLSKGISVRHTISVCDSIDLVAQEMRFWREREKKKHQIIANKTNHGGSALKVRLCWHHKNFVANESKRTSEEEEKTHTHTHSQQVLVFNGTPIFAAVNF